MKSLSVGNHLLFLVFPASIILLCH